MLTDRLHLLESQLHRVCSVQQAHASCDAGMRI